MSGHAAPKLALEHSHAKAITSQWMPTSFSVPSMLRMLIKLWGSQIERAALERALEQAEAEPSGNTAPAAAAPGPEELWVDRYRPRVYFDLLSDEATNRDLLRHGTLLVFSFGAGFLCWRTSLVCTSPHQADRVDAASLYASWTPGNNYPQPKTALYVQRAGSLCGMQALDPRRVQIIPAEPIRLWGAEPYPTPHDCMQVAEGLGRVRFWGGACRQQCGQRQARHRHGGLDERQGAGAAGAAHPAPLRRAGSACPPPCSGSLLLLCSSAACAGHGGTAAGRSSAARSHGEGRACCRALMFASLCCAEEKCVGAWLKPFQGNVGSLAPAS